MMQVPISWSCYKIQYDLLPYALWHHPSELSITVTINSLLCQPTCFGVVCLLKLFLKKSTDFPDRANVDRAPTLLERVPRGR